MSMRQSLRLLLQHISGPALFLDPRGKIVFCNDSFQVLSGRSEEELQGREALQLFPGHPWLAQVLQSPALPSLHDHAEGDLLLRHVQGKELRKRARLQPLVEGTSLQGYLLTLERLSGDGTGRKERGAWNSAIDQAVTLASLQMFQAMFDAVQETMFLLDPYGKILLANETAAMRHKVPAARMIGKNIFDFFDAPVAELRRRAFERVRREKTSYVWEDERVSHFFSNHLYPVLGPDGEVHALAVFARDISDRRQAEEALSHSEARFRSIFCDSAVAMATVDRRGRPIEVNAAMQRLLGYDLEELRRAVFFDFIHPQDMEASQQTFQEMLQGKREMLSSERRLLRKNGQILWARISSTALRDREGNFQFAVAMAEDIHERKRVEQQFAEEQRFLSEVFDSVQDGISVLDKELRVLRVNTIMERWFAHAQPLVGRKCYEVYHNRNEPCESCPALHVLRTGEPAHQDVPRIGPHGKAVGWLEIHARPFRSSSGERLGVIESVRDITERKVFEQTLAEKEERYRLIAESSRDLICIHAPDGRIQYASPSVSRLLGYSPEEVMGKDPYVFWFHPEDTERIRTEAHRPLLRGETHPGVVYRIRCKNGAWRWFETLNQVSCSAAGEVTQIYSFSRDVSERVQAEELRAETERRMRDILESIPLIAINLDAAGQVLFANAAASRLTGYRREELLGANWFELLVPEEDRLKIYPLFTETIHSGRGFPYYYENEIRLRDGRRRLIAWHSTLLREPGGHFFAAAAIGQDITEIRRRERQQQAHLDFLQILIDAIPSPIFYKNCQRAYQGCNRAFAKILGLNMADLIGKTARDLFVAEDAAAYEAKDQEVFEKKVAILYETQLRHADGTRRLMIVHKAPYFNEHGEIAGLVGVTLDLSERKNLEEEQRRLDEKVLQLQKQQSLSVLAGGFAHDFNNLLMVILGNVNIIREEIPSQLQLDTTIEEIENAAKRGAELTRQMLAYAGKGKAILKPIDLSRLVREMAHLLEINVSAKAVLRFEYGDDLPLLQADEQQLRQVVISLVTNATEALGDQPGLIQVRTGARELGRDELTGCYLGEPLHTGLYLFLEVADDGPGMDLETIGKVCDPFFSTKFTGRGLGLTAVLGIARSHKGVVQLTSAPDQGTTVTVWLPVLEPSES